MRNKNLLSNRKQRRIFTQNAINFIVLVSMLTFSLCVPVFADGTSGTDALVKARNLLSSVCTVGGTLWGAWGLVRVGLGLHDHNSNGLQQGIWQLLSGVLIVAAGGIIGDIDMTLSDAGTSAPKQ